MAKRKSKILVDFNAALNVLHSANVGGRHNNAFCLSCADIYALMMTAVVGETHSIDDLQAIADTIGGQVRKVLAYRNADGTAIYKYCIIGPWMLDEGTDE